jgi:ribonuclease P/MRP protein subunit RPP1
MPLLPPPNLSFFARVRVLFALLPLASSLRLEFSETRKTYRAVFSEPKVVIPRASIVQPTGASGSLETKPSAERRPEAESAAAVTPPVSTAAETQRQINGRQSKRTRDCAEPADSGTMGSARKKRKGKKTQAG